MKILDSRCLFSRYKNTPNFLNGKQINLLKKTCLSSPQRIIQWFGSICQTNFNPILHGGGHYGPPNHISICRFRRGGARLTKILDFVPLNTWQVPEKSFLEIFFESVRKLNVKNFQGSSSLRWKIKKSKKNLFFCKKYYFF